MDAECDAYSLWFYFVNELELAKHDVYSMMLIADS